MVSVCVMIGQVMTWVGFFIGEGTIISNIGGEVGLRTGIVSVVRCMGPWLLVGACCSMMFAASDPSNIAACEQVVQGICNCAYLPSISVFEDSQYCMSPAIRRVFFGRMIDPSGNSG